jgi:thiol:disulfide interchange protein DsbG
MSTYYIEIRMNKYILALSAALIGSQVQAATPAALPAPIKQLEKQGIRNNQTLHGSRWGSGLVGKISGNRGDNLSTPDKKHAISGYMYDENGSNLSEQVIKERFTSCWPRDVENTVQSCRYHGRQQ